MCLFHTVFLMRTIRAAAAACTFIFPQPLHGKENCRCHDNENQNVKNVHIISSQNSLKKEGIFRRLKPELPENVLFIFKILFR